MGLSLEMTVTLDDTNYMSFIKALFKAEFTNNLKITESLNCVIDGR